MIYHLTRKQFEKIWFPLQELEEKNGGPCEEDDWNSVYSVDGRILYWRNNFQSRFKLRYNEFESSSAKSLYGRIIGKEQYINFFLLQL